MIQQKSFDPYRSNAEQALLQYERLSKYREEDLRTVLANIKEYRIAPLVVG